MDKRASGSGWRQSRAAGESAGGSISRYIPRTKLFTPSATRRIRRADLVPSRVTRPGMGPVAPPVRWAGNARDRGSPAGLAASTTCEWPGHRSRRVWPRETSERAWVESSVHPGPSKIAGGAALVVGGQGAGCAACTASAHPASVIYTGRLSLSMMDASPQCAPFRISDFLQARARAILTLAKKGLTLAFCELPLRARAIKSGTGTHPGTASQSRIGMVGMGRERVGGPICPIDRIHPESQIFGPP